MSAVIYTPSPPRRPPPTGLPKTADERAKAALILIERLSDGLSGELATRESSAMAGGGRDRQTLAIGLDELCRHLRADPDGMKALDTAVIKRLATQLQDLKALAETSAFRLGARTKAQSTLVETLVGAANEERNTAGRYALARGMLKSAAARPSAVTAVSLNTRL